MNPSVTYGADRENVDPEEQRRFEALADAWWDADGAFWPLHGLNRLRSEWLADALPELVHGGSARDSGLAGMDLVDIGCGGGLLSESMGRLGADVLGIDVVDRNIDIAVHHARGTGLPVRYEATTAETLVRRGVTFDTVLCMEVVEHVPDVDALVRACMALVRPGGALVLATINRTALAWLLAIVGAEYVLRLLPRGTHQWRRFVPPSRLESQLEAGGFRIERRTGVRVNPFARRFSLTSSLAVNYMLVATRPQATADPMTAASD